jgi:hypothetical protein
MAEALYERGCARNPARTLPSLLGDPLGKRQRSIRVLRECQALAVWVNVVKSADLIDP